MVLILNGIVLFLIIRIKDIKPSGGRPGIMIQWVHTGHVILSILLPVAASLYVQPIAHCADVD